MNTNCKEITDVKEPQPVVPQTAIEEPPMQEEQEPDDFVDPEDPLYGLEQRLKGFSMDDESKRIIKQKLVEASQKIK